MKSLKNISGRIGIAVLIALFLTTGLLCYTFQSELFGQASVSHPPQYPVVHRGNTLIKEGCLRVEGVGIETATIGYVSATAITIGSPGGPLACVGLAAGAAEIGTTEGFIYSDDGADFTRFTWQLPDDWIDTDTAGELTFQFDVLERRAGAGIQIDIRFFEYGNTTPIYTDTLTIADGTARGWVAMDTDTLGSDADVGPGDTFIIEITGQDDNMDFNLYGVRCHYRMGIEMVTTE